MSHHRNSKFRFNGQKLIRNESLIVLFSPSFNSLLLLSSSLVQFKRLLCKLLSPRKRGPNERRVALIPDSVKKLTRLGLNVKVESGLGRDARFTDEAYSESGASITTDRDELLGESDIILRVRKPALAEVQKIKRGHHSRELSRSL